MLITITVVVSVSSCTLTSYSLAIGISTASTFAALAGLYHLVHLVHYFFFLNSFQATAPLMAQLFGVYFSGGAYLPQKSDLVPHLETQRVSELGHVSFYILNRSPVCFVWAAPTL